MSPQDYLRLRHDENSLREICEFSLSAHSEDFAIIGIPFIQNYYTALDNGQQRVGFALHKDSTAHIQAIIPETVPDNTYKILAFSFLAISLVFAIIIGLICWVC